MGQQLALYQVDTPMRRSAGVPAPSARRTARTPAGVCAGCRAREARYGFRSERDPVADRPRTLCFECFRAEIGRRQAVAARLARGWDATQAHLPLAATLQRLDLRRRRAQIAARHALEQAPESAYLPDSPLNVSADPGAEKLNCSLPASPVTV